MLAILKKEIRSFFNTPLGFLVLLVFSVLTGLFLWVFKGDYNIFDLGFADLVPFFLLAPWVFLFLIPSLSMRTFSEERKLGTFEVLTTAPINKFQLVFGKFLGVFCISILAVVPCLVYVFAIEVLGLPPGNYDSGILMGSFLGLLLLMALYSAIGVFASTISPNQIIAFMAAALLCFLVYYGPFAVSTLMSFGYEQNIVAAFGAKAHVEQLARGIVDTRDLLYFVLGGSVFLVLSFMQIKKS